MLCGRPLRGSNLKNQQRYQFLEAEGDGAPSLRKLSLRQEDPFPGPKLSFFRSVAEASAAKGPGCRSAISTRRVAYCSAALRSATRLEMQ